MTSKRFIAIFASIFLLGALPLVMQQPNGASSAGLSHGFTFPIEHLAHLAVFCVLGVFASFLRGLALTLVPLSFVLMYVVGITLKLDEQRYELLPMFMLGAVLLFALCVSLARRRSHLIGIVIAASAGFHFGRYYGATIPPIASPLYFLMGNIIAFALIFATSISFGLTMRHDGAKAESEEAKAES